MVHRRIATIAAVCLISTYADNLREKTATVNRFPDDFEFGAATSSYQIEGAWDVHGKGRSIWDHLVHNKPESVFDRTNGDTAAKSYYFYKRDVQMLKELGVDNYRFSISWTRIMPNGRADEINPLGIKYYNNVINELLANGITPFVTMYHWDLPQNLQEQGGWLNEEIVDWFGDYARILYKNFGDRVKHWLTLNEPYIHCYYGYGIAYHAPAHYSPGSGYYECGRQYLLANARAYHIYDDEFRASQGGQVGFVISMEWVMPNSTDFSDDIHAARDYAAFHIDHFMHPIFSKEGNYPQIVINRVAAASVRQGLNVSRLRPFSNEQIQYLKGSADFLGLNHYFSTYVYRDPFMEGSFKVPSIEDDLMVGKYKDPAWPHFGITYEYGPGLYQLLNYLKDNYDNPLIYITENGAASPIGLNDDGRVSYYRNYLSSLMKAVNEGVNVKGYFAWSLMDNFEWARGYTVRFGMYEVDMNDTNRKRTPRKSALVYKEIVRSRMIDFSYEPDPYYKGKGYANGVVSLSLYFLALIVFNLFG